MVADGELLEHAEFAGNRYGTPRRPVLDRLAAGTPTLLEIELDGARQVRRSMPDAQFVFLAPPSLDVLVQRLSGRGTESPDAMVARLRHAEAELAAADEFDEVVVNHDVEQAARAVAGLITAATDPRTTPGCPRFDRPQPGDARTTANDERLTVGSERLEDVLDALLGVAEQHLGVVAEEQRVLHAGVARRHRALEHDDVVRLPDVAAPACRRSGWPGPRPRPG